MRTEYNDDGSTTKRSTREWAYSLMKQDGETPALCDVVNGTKLYASGTTAMETVQIQVISTKPQGSTVLRQLTGPSRNYRDSNGNQIKCLIAGSHGDKESMETKTGFGKVQYQ
jgi:hypothetical protein